MPEIAGIHYRWHEEEKTYSSPIILIHDACLDSRLWPLSIRRLEGYPVLTVDLPGHGQSQSICQHSVHSYSLSLMALLTRLDLRAPLLVGVGIGGSIVMEFVAQFPDRVSGFVAINSAPGYFVPNAALDLIGAHQYARAFGEMQRKGMRPFHHPEARAEIINIAQSQRPSVLAADLQMMHHYRYPYEWGEIAAVPGLFLYGTGDHLLRGIPAQLPGKLTSKMIPGHGHWLPLEDPDLVRRELLSFVGAALPPCAGV